ncbi:hypothetical protein DSO57_1029095 [Entomophthora muscae]|uniref:Uncharacterized protein n=1 Tax=Entomophthora muscae TaxID=34485 RepID=A0ACC2S3E0_9FUNG|nr:hypothetical protein DSO57_1029095 [Entomophthora muscae]
MYCFVNLSLATTSRDYSFRDTRTNKPNPKTFKKITKKATKATKKTSDPSPSLEEEPSEEEPTPSPSKSSTGHKFVHSQADEEETPPHISEEEHEDLYNSGDATPTEDTPETWDILKVQNICNYEEEFQLPDVLPISFPIMSSKGNAGFYHDGFMFKCNDEQKHLVLHNYKCEGPSCLTTNGFTHLVRIDNSFTLEAQTQGQDSNPDPESLQAARPED